MATPEEILASAEAYIADITSDASSAVERLESIASLPFQTWVGFNALESVDIERVGAVVSEDEYPVLEKTSFDTSLGEFDPNAYKSNVYDSTFFEFLEPFLIEQIEDGGPGISAAVQTALWEDQRERDLQLLADSLDKVRSAYGRTGFPLPTQMLSGQENELIKKYQDDYSNRNREITKLIAERASDFVKTAISTGTTMEKTRMDFALGFARVYTEITSSIIQQYKAIQDANIAEFRGNIDVILAKLQVGKLNADLELTYQTQVLKKWEIEATVATERTRSLIQEAEQATSVKLEAAKTLATYYAALAASAASQLTGVAMTSTTQDLTAE